MLAKGTVLAALFSLGTSLWWISVREWTWNPTRNRSRNLVRLALLAVWPFLLGSGIGLYTWDRFLLRSRPAFALLDPELMIVGTALIASLGVCLVLTRREWSRH